MLKKIILPVIAASLLIVAAPASEADASPLSPDLGIEMGSRIRIGGAITFPIGGHRRHVRHVRHVAPSGYYKTVYETRTRKIWHEAELVGYDSHGRPVYSEGHYDYETYTVPVRVWVPVTHTRRIVHRTVRPRGHITIGGSWRIR